MTRLCPLLISWLTLFIQNTEKNLTDDEYGTGMDLAVKQQATVVLDSVNYKAEASPFQSFMFQQNVLQNVKPLDWWKSQADRLNQETLSVVYQLLLALRESFPHSAWYIQNSAIDLELKKLES